MHLHSRMYQQISTKRNTQHTHSWLHLSPSFSQYTNLTGTLYSLPLSHKLILQVGLKIVFCPELNQLSPQASHNHLNINTRPQRFNIQRTQELNTERCCSFAYNICQNQWRRINKTLNDLRYVCLNIFGPHALKKGDQRYQYKKGGTLMTEEPSTWV